MGRLPDELGRLKQRYDQLVADANKGLISREDAYKLLGQLTVIDAAGALWGLNDEGQFTRRRNPAENAEVTHPGAFAPVSMPMAERGEVHNQVPPAREVAMPVDGAPQSGRKGIKSRIADITDRRRQAPAEPVQPFGAQEEAQTGRIATPFSRHTTNQRQRQVAPFVKAVLARPGTAAVAGLIVVSLVVSLVTKGGAVPLESGDTAAATTAPFNNGPSSADVQRVVLALQSGPQAALGVIAPGSVEPVAVAEASGEWATHAAAGLLVTPSQPLPGAGVFQQQWELKDSSGTVVVAYSVTWAQQAGAWILTALPARI